MMALATPFGPVIEAVNIKYHWQNVFPWDDLDRYDKFSEGLLQIGCHKPQNVVGMT